MEDSKIILAFGEVLKTRRTEKNISQEKLAFMVNLHPTYISMLERGKRQPSISVFIKLANKLGHEPHELMKSVEEKLL